MDAADKKRETELLRGNWKGAAEMGGLFRTPSFLLNLLLSLALPLLSPPFPVALLQPGKKAAIPNGESGK